MLGHRDGGIWEGQEATQTKNAWKGHKEISYFVS